MNASKRSQSKALNESRQSDLQDTMLCFSNLFHAPNKTLHPTTIMYFNEGIADYIGLVVSYDAFKWYTKKHWTELLVTHKSLSVEQMFFVGSAFTRCYATTEFEWKDIKDHPPKFHRVNRAFSNFAPFAYHWFCTESDAMVAKTRCNFLL